MEEEFVIDRPGTYYITGATVRVKSSNAVVHAGRGALVAVEGKAEVFAEQGSKVDAITGFIHAKAGSTVVAWMAKVVAEKDSIVYATDSSVDAQKGSIIHAGYLADVTARKGSVVFLDDKSVQLEVENGAVVLSKDCKLLRPPVGKALLWDGKRFRRGPGVRRKE